MKRQINFLLILLVSVVTTSCSTATKEYELIAKKDLENEFFPHSSAAFEGYYYRGTDTNFHYFVSKWKLKKNRKFKLQIEDLNVKNTFSFKQKELRIYLFKIDKSIVFGENKYHKLYVINK